MNREQLQELLTKVATIRVPPGTIFKREVDWGPSIGKVTTHFRRLPYLETQEIRERTIVQDENDPAQMEKARATVRRGPIIQIAAMLCDEHGNKLATEDEVEKWDPTIIDRHYIACMDVSVATEGAREDAEKKSEPTPAAEHSSS